MKAGTNAKFHTKNDLEWIPPKLIVTQDRDLSYGFHTHFHPYAGQLMQRLLRGSTAGLQAADTDYRKKTDGSFEKLPDGKTNRPVLYEDIFTSTQYDPTDLVDEPYPVKDLDFGASGAYSVYNWELFFHVPITIAIHLSQNQRFAEAQQWFHFLFDPTDDSDGPTPERFWKVRPFQSTDVKKIEEILVNLATGADPELREETIRSIEAWRDAPFRPHLVARYRQQAYMYKTVMAYLDNLIAWGDSLFRQDTGEAIDEALMYYVLAANILGPRPLAVPKKGSVRPQTYANLRDDLDKFGNAMRAMESEAPFDLMPAPTDSTGDEAGAATLRSLGNALYFCVPRNDKLLSYWDTVADRLFKIHNSLNIQGVFRQLALFEPPIDPGMLAAAAAAGLDVGAIVSGVNQPLPLVRFQLLAQKAGEICQEVKSMGNSLLSAMEKEDAEALAVLRAQHERMTTEMVEHVKYAQLQEASKSKEALLKTLASAVQRYTYFEKQLGKTAVEIEAAIPALGDLDTDGLGKMKFSMTEPEVKQRDIEPDIARDLSGSGGKIISSFELNEMKGLDEARSLQEQASNLDMIAKFLSLIPELGAQAEPMGVGAALQFGGRALSGLLSLSASGTRTSAEDYSYQASKAAKIGGYARREQDWAQQSNLAADEITQIFKQLRAAQLREAIADLELKNHRKQMDFAKEIESFLNAEGREKNGKKTGKSLYTWLKREVKALHGQAFQFAFDSARKAERALQHELGDPGLRFLQFGYLAGKEGLLAGEKLHLDIKRMEMAYLDLHEREAEMTKSVSLMQVDPLALIELRATGSCTVRLPETLFDLDAPGQYFRRIKTVALSVPCVTGPYVGVNCKLTLLKSSIRKSPLLSDGEYARVDAEDDRFSDYFGSMESVVASGAQNDSGLFETNLRDERYLPFEHSGAISEWQLDLPANPAKGDPRQFDYDTISDVILHVKYTAREGGGLLRRGATQTLRDAIAAAQAAGSVRLFSARHDFPNEWSRFQTQTPGTDERFELALNLREEHYPYWFQKDSSAVTRVDLFARSAKASPPPSLDVWGTGDATDTQAVADSLTKNTDLGGLLIGKLANVPLPAAPVGELQLFFDDRSLEDLWLAITWGS